MSKGSAKTHVGWLQTAINRERELALEQAAMPLPFRERMLRETATENFADAMRAFQLAVRELDDVQRADLGEFREGVAAANLAETKQVLGCAVKELDRLGLRLPKRPEGWVKVRTLHGDNGWVYRGPVGPRNASMPRTI